MATSTADQFFSFPFFFSKFLDPIQTKEGIPLSTQGKPCPSGPSFVCGNLSSSQGIPAPLASALFVEAPPFTSVLDITASVGLLPSDLQLKVSLYPWPQLCLRDSSLPSLPQLGQLGQLQIQNLRSQASPKGVVS